MSPDDPFKPATLADLIPPELRDEARAVEAAQARADAAWEQAAQAAIDAPPQPPHGPDEDFAAYLERTLGPGPTYWTRDDYGRNVKVPPPALPETIAFEARVAGHRAVIDLRNLLASRRQVVLCPGLVFETILIRNPAPRHLKDNFRTACRLTIPGQPTTPIEIVDTPQEAEAILEGYRRKYARVIREYNDYLAAKTRFANAVKRLPAVLYQAGCTDPVDYATVTQVLNDRACEGRPRASQGEADRQRFADLVEGLGAALLPTRLAKQTYGVAALVELVANL